MTGANAEQRAWFFYDWANSAYITTVATVLVGPYLTNVAERAACGHVGTVGRPCQEHLSVLGLSVSAGSLVFYVITASTLLSAFVLPFVGAIADRVPSRRRLMGQLAWSGAAVTALLFLVTGSNWQLGCLLLLLSNILYGSSLVVYDALLIDV
ncbi:MAG TPA: MFS transporter, partial [Aeromicrobium sp.]|nr:MFS transporter [Aeromicrobium sp.]